MDLEGLIGCGPEGRMAQPASTIRGVTSVGNVQPIPYRPTLPAPGETTIRLERAVHH